MPGEASNKSVTSKDENECVIGTRRSIAARDEYGKRRKGSGANRTIEALSVNDLEVNHGIDTILDGECGCNDKTRVRLDPRIVEVADLTERTGL